MKTNNTYKRKKYISVMHLQKLKHKEKINKKTVLGHVRVLSGYCPRHVRPCPVLTPIVIREVTRTYPGQFEPGQKNVRVLRNPRTNTQPAVLP